MYDKFDLTAKAKTTTTHTPPRTMTTTDITTAEAFEIGRKSAADYNYPNIYEADLCEAGGGLVAGGIAADQELIEARKWYGLIDWYTALLDENMAGGSNLYRAYAEGWEQWKEDTP